MEKDTKKLAFGYRSLVSLFLFGILGGGLLLFVIFALPRILAEITYPLAYEDIIIKEAKAHDLDPFLVAAVIYAESRYNPKAVSYVGARGLMQLMPATAKGISGRIGDNNYSVDSLFDPATNIEYGTFHLQGLMGRYNRNVPAALAGYNGGGGVGDRYIKGDRTTIPRETLNYVVKVTNAEKKYRELYKDRLDPPPAPTPQPTPEPNEEEPVVIPENSIVSRILAVIQRTLAGITGQ